MPVIVALRKLRQENHKFKASLGYIASSRAVSLSYIDHISNKKPAKQLLVI
jgi:hypothetical protein